ncbi:flagellin lysine-N-methylase [Parendozoicomonas sp. Alg238-R29]|uniref:flagellin lysine-N-methylase n=1 Tax=Parendozoicomonas sp. Alg238-R29 TaxID=2993446 RepID=UPI00248D4B79|nr:flagellin lysine-N-methylase [Parendozoicomonas sp. Alg238-R29]
MDAPVKPVLFPRFYRKFSCIGAACENNCCHDWCISLDKKTWQAYEQHSDKQLAELLRHSITIPDEPTAMDYRRMTLSENGVCPAYRESDGLCDIHDRLGEKLLSETCKTYPRRLTQTPEALEPSLAISCPEAARLILLDPAAMDRQEDLLITTDFTPTAVMEGPPPYFQRFRETALTVVSELNLSPDEQLFRLGLLFNFVATSQQAGENPEQVLSSFGVMSQSGAFSNMYNNLPEGLIVQAEVLKHLLLVPSFWKINSVLADIHQQFVDTLNRDYAVDGHVDLFQVIATGYRNNFTPVCETHGYALTNFFKHWIYSSDICHLSGDELMKKYSGFLLQYSIIRSYLSVLSSEGDHEKLLVNVVHALSRGFDHHPPFLEKLLAYLGVSGIGHPIQMMGLLKLEQSQGEIQEVS